MKKIIEGKTYNTETALLLGDWQNLWKGDYHYCREELYHTKKGTYFLYGEGGALSCYARYIGGSATGGADFQVLSDREAKEWAEKKLSAEEYCKIFVTVQTSLRVHRADRTITHWPRAYGSSPQAILNGRML